MRPFFFKSYLLWALSRKFQGTKIVSSKKSNNFGSNWSWKFKLHPSAWTYIVLDVVILEHKTLFDKIVMVVKLLSNNTQFTNELLGSKLQTDCILFCIELPLHASELWSISHSTLEMKFNLSTCFYLPTEAKWIPMHFLHG